MVIFFQVINDPDQDSYSFEILHTLATDAGRYVVVASNAEGKAQCSVSLNVTAMDKGEVEDFRTLLKTRSVGHLIYGLFCIMDCKKITRAPIQYKDVVLPV